jgi:1-deoxy-D-xylulose-5-phosphate synthase
VKLDGALCPLPIGKGEVLRTGEDVAILAIGATVAPALDAAKELATKDIEATVANARFVKPLDSALVLDLASRIKRVVTVEENTLSGGFGSSVADLLQKSGITGVQVRSLGLPDAYIEHGTQAILRAKYGLDAKGITNQVLSLFPALEANSLLKVKGEAKTISR